MPKPPVIFDRDDEWTALSRFAEHPAPGPMLAIVYGARRQGKSWLLTRLADACDGWYHAVIEEDSVSSLAEYAEDLTEWSGSPAELKVEDWRRALKITFGLLEDKARRTGTPALLILDEYPYLIAHTPGIDSYLQHLIDEGVRRGGPPIRIVLCGSAYSVMSNLVSGDRPLYGRAGMALNLRAFDHRTAARYWNIKDPQLAFRNFAIVGGVPGYRSLSEAAMPGARFETEANLDAWVCDAVLNPISQLSTEADRLLLEDQRSRNRALYNGVLRQIAAGRTAPSEIGGNLRREVGSIQYPLEVLTDTGFIDRVEDVIFRGKTRYRITNPLIRFSHAIISPNRSNIDRGRIRPAWEKAKRQAMGSLIFGPAFEQTCRDWIHHDGWERLGFSEAGEVGETVISSGVKGRPSHQVDLVMLDPESTARAKLIRVALIGEAKYTSEPRSRYDIKRLEAIRQRMAAIPRIDVGDAKLAVFSRSGFAADIRSEAKNRDDVLLISLEDIYAPRSGARGPR